MRIFYTADPHFRHYLVAGLRGFGSREEHDAVIEENWNKTVQPADRIFILGDVAMNWTGMRDVLCRLHGIKILIAGNHDPVWPGHVDAWRFQRDWLADDLFYAIMPWARRRAAGLEFLLSHFPYAGDHNIPDRHARYRLRDEGSLLLHGHTHSSEKTGDHPRQLHVGLDAWGLAPVPEEHVLVMLKEMR